VFVPAACASSVADRAGLAKLAVQNLHHRRRSSSPRLAHQQMNVFRHHHVTDQRKVVPFPNLSQNPKKKTARPLGLQKRIAPIATAGDEVQVTQSVAAFETMFHSKARTLRKRCEGCGTRTFVSRLWLILVWYHPPAL
jgi:hypothetical protein